jgi:hypothetical protein
MVLRYSLDAELGTLDHHEYDLITRLAVPNRRALWS